MSKHNRERRLFWKIGLRKKKGQRFTESQIDEYKLAYFKKQQQLRLEGSR